MSKRGHRSRRNRGRGSRGSGNKWRFTGPNNLPYCRAKTEKVTNEQNKVTCVKCIAIIEQLHVE